MKYKRKLKAIVEQSNSWSGKYFDIIIQLLIILSIISFSIDTLPNLSNNLRSFLNYFEIISVAVFTLEYIFRLYVSDSKVKYLFSFYGVIDLLAILPFYLGLSIDLRSIRILRLFRLFRLFKLFRFNNALQRYIDAFNLIKSELLLFLTTTLFLLYLSSVGIYYFENTAQPEKFESVFHCLWWAVATFTTIGYGDIYPITVGGKIFTSIVVLIGIGVVAVPTGLFASALTRSNESDNNNQES